MKNKKAKVNNKFVILICSYNNSKYCIKNIDSAINQKYKNYRILYVNDASTDDTLDKVYHYVIDKNLSSNFIKIVNNKVRQGLLKNQYSVINSLVDDDEIVVNLDGDDWLSGDNVLNRLNNIYQKDVFVTYGNYIRSDGEHGITEALPPEVIRDASYRDYKWCTSHLRTFKANIFKKIKEQDLKIDDDWIPICGDLAIMYPILEMAGGRQKFIKEILYVYNTENELSENKSMEVEKIKIMDAYIRHIKEKYEKLK